jgi:hypothetical protein
MLDSGCSIFVLKKKLATRTRCQPLGRFLWDVVTMGLRLDCRTCPERSRTDADVVDQAGEAIAFFNLQLWIGYGPFGLFAL